MTARAGFCADASRGRAEPVLGTASRIDRWLLVEAPGAWNGRALPTARDLDDELLLALQQRAREQHARTLLIRRHDRPPAPGTRTLFAADSRPGCERLWRTVVSDPDLPDVVLPFDGDGDWSDAATWAGVCTQGAHDPCCAVRGRPVAEALATSHRDVTWEVSHIGGDRFAANVLLLPWGHYLGGVEADTVGQVVDDTVAGRRVRDHYRGRSCWTAPVQAALALAAEELGAVELDALRPVRATADGDHRWTVTMNGVRDVVAVVRQELGAPARLTCRADRPVPAPTWTLVSLERPT